MAKRTCFGAVALAGLVAAMAGNLPAVAAGEPPRLPGELLGYAFYTQAGQADLQDPETPGQAGTVTLHELTACLPLPVYQRDGWQGLAGPLLEWHRFDFSGLDGLEDLDLYSVALLLGAVYNGLEHWEFTASAMPGFYTDFRQTDRDDFKTMFHGQAAWWVSESLQLVLGAAYDSALGDDELYPVGGLRWDPLPQWSFRLMFPEPMVVWMPAARLALYLHA
ncbi:MAG: hypothetical protein LC725_09615, partial [Lentisphaerae bacterium]|nr:hypothetical protein [Lentisphaerota bacterium]